MLLGFPPYVPCLGVDGGECQGRQKLGNEFLHLFSCLLPAGLLRETANSPPIKMPDALPDPQWFSSSVQSFYSIPLRQY